MNEGIEPTYIDGDAVEYGGEIRIEKDEVCILTICRDGEISEIRASYEGVLYYKLLHADKASPIPMWWSLEAHPGPIDLVVGVRKLRVPSHHE